MKRYRLYIWTTWLLASCLLPLASCSVDEMLEEQPLQQASSRTAAYLNLHITDHQHAATRASEQQENAIYDGILAIFEGTAEGNATLKSAVVIDQLVNNPGNSTSINITQRVTGTHNYDDRKLYVLTLLNTTSTGFSVKDDMLYLNGTSLQGKKRSDIQAMTINSVGSTEEHVGLYMTCTYKEDGTVLRVVYPNDASKQSYLYDTEEEARASGAKYLNVDVERAAAKVSVASNLASGDNLTGITLNGTSAKARFHHMAWALNNYNTQCYAIRNGYKTPERWATSLTGSGIPISLDTSAPNIFDVYQQQAYEAGDAVYVAENTTDTEADQTEIIVEVQLKDASNMLMRECFNFHDDNTLYTSPEQLIAYYKTGWATHKGRTEYAAIKDRTVDEVYKHPTIVLNADGSVTVTLTNESFSAEETTALNALATELSGYTKGFREGRMYYTYKIKHDETHTYGVVRNNAYNLTLNSLSGIGRPTP
ncbi:MAG: fimbria major subunit [Prevotella sp.]|nr:fimbria major subunit [Prevotella sp.]